jgi:multidrug efflux pump subunit AcrA (membrane-fusion protein)
LARLRNETAKTRAQGPELAKLQAQLVELTQQLKTAREALINQQANMKTQATEAAQSAVAADQAARAASIACINNLKQVCLGLRIWANDHNETLPPAVADLHNELNNPRVLTCPSDPLRNPVEDWQQLAPGSISYLYHLPNVAEAQANPEQPMVTCPIHGHVGRADGSVIAAQPAMASP